jgi:enoyl-CoA hydratase/carnithine racemase
MADTLRIDAAGKVRTITINRPARRNALNDATLLALRDAIQDANRDGVAAIVWTGEGTVSFCAGSDIKELAAQSVPERIAHTALGQSVGDAIEDSRAVVIAAIEGYCLGGGLELALACDLRVVGATATMGLPEVQINALPSWGGTFRLGRVVGIARAKELAIFGRRLDASEAVAWGLAAELVPEGTALARATEIARTLTGGSDPATIARAKGLVNAGFGADSRVGRHLELYADAAQLASPAFEQSVDSFGTPPPVS